MYVCITQTKGTDTKHLKYMLQHAIRFFNRYFNDMPFSIVENMRVFWYVLYSRYVTNNFPLDKRFVRLI